MAVFFRELRDDGTLELRDDGTLGLRDDGTSGLRDIAGDARIFFVIPRTRGLVVSWSRRLVIPWSRSLSVLLSCCLVGTSLSHSQSFSAIPSHSQSRNLYVLHSLKSSAAIAEALPRYGGCFWNYARQACPPNIAIEECDYSPIISKILIAAVATGVPGPKIAAAPS